MLDGGSDPPTRQVNYEGEKGRPIILYMDSLPCAAVQKRLYRSDRDAVWDAESGAWV